MPEWEREKVGNLQVAITSQGRVEENTTGTNQRKEPNTWVNIFLTNSTWQIYKEVSVQECQGLFLLMSRIFFASMAQGYRIDFSRRLLVDVV